METSTFWKEIILLYIMVGIRQEKSFFVIKQWVARNIHWFMVWEQDRLCYSFFFHATAAAISKAFVYSNYNCLYLLS